MSAKLERQLILPGAHGWEVWAAEADKPLALRASATLASRPGELDNLTAGEALLLFPVRDVVAMPFRVQTADAAMFEDLAKLHVERLGVRVDPLGGQLSDHFLIEADAEQASLLAVVLNPPADGFMPNRPVAAFDFTARCLPLEDEVVTVWQELDRWVFAIARHGKLVYCQATSAGGSAPGELVATEIRMAITQLALQGLVLRPQVVTIWVPADSDATGVTEPLAAALQTPVTAATRPAPVWPETPSHLLPADVRAEREARRKRQRQRAITTAVAAAIIATCAWLGWQLWKEKRDLRALQVQAAELQARADVYQLHQQKWAELAPVIEPKQWPIELVLRVVSQIPRGANLRISQIVIQSRDIRIVGEAPDPTPTGQFDLALRRSSELSGYTWQNTPATQNNRGTWSFTFVGTPSAEPGKP